MKNIGLKIKEVYLPFLLVSIGTIVFYNLFRWIFDIKLGVLPLKEDLLNLWIPMFLPWIPVLIWLRRRIRILNIRGGQDNGYIGYQFAMTLAITIPIVVSQDYMVKGSYGLIEIDGIAEVKDFENEKYFEINSFRVNKDYSLPYVTARTSGRGNESLNFYFYLACPFDSTNSIWYGVEYSENLSNRISDDRKDTVYSRFLAESLNEFETYNFLNVNYFEKMGHSDDRDGFLKAIKEFSPMAIESEQIILVPRTNDYEQRVGNVFPWIFISFGIGSLVLLIMVIIPKVNEKELVAFKKNKPLKEDDLKLILEFLDPRGPYKGTAILLLVNIVVFVSMVLAGLNIVSPTAVELLEIGGNRRSEVMDGEYWRLLSSVFIHGGVMHLFMNLFGLGLAGSLLEGLVGRTQLIISFVVCGVLAGLTSIYWHENTVSVGASGAIFGLFGLILAFTVFRVFPIHMRKITWILLGSYAGVGLLIGFLGGIDNAAHIGGLISGFTIGGIFILTGKGVPAKEHSGK